VKAGDGVSECPAWQDESGAHYLWRLAAHLGFNPSGPEPPVTVDDAKRAASEREETLTKVGE